MRYWKRQKLRKAWPTSVSHVKALSASSFCLIYNHSVSCLPLYTRSTSTCLSSQSLFLYLFSPKICHPCFCICSKLHFLLFVSKLIPILKAIKRFSSIMTSSQLYFLQRQRVSHSEIMLHGLNFQLEVSSYLSFSVIFNLALS